MVLFVFQFLPVCNPGKLINFVGTVGGETFIGRKRKGFSVKKQPTIEKQAR